MILVLRQIRTTGLVLFIVGALVPAAHAQLCEDSCRYAFDGECDDGEPGAATDACDYGTDCGDCGLRFEATTSYEAVCLDAPGEECVGEGSGALTYVCELGTDCGEDGPAPGSESAMVQGLFMTPAGLAPLEYRMVDGMALFQGDIIIDPSDDLTGLSHLLASGSSSPQSEQTEEDGVGMTQSSILAIANWEWLWPNLTVPYELSPSISPKIAKRVTDAMQHWEDKTEFRFRQATASDVHAAYFFNGPGVDPSDGKSVTGMRNYCEGLTKAAYLKKYSSPCRCETKPCHSHVLLGDDIPTTIIIHEIGHLLGLFHEQCREDRDQFVAIHWGNIEDGQTQNFKKLSKKTQSLKQQDLYYANPYDPTHLAYSWGDYDTYSIMHYGSSSFAKFDWAKAAAMFLAGVPIPIINKEAKLSTITRLQGNPYIDKPTKLSQGDVDNIHHIYSKICAGELPGGQQNVGIPLDYFQKNDIPVARCRTHSYFHDTTDYYDLSLTIWEKGGIPLDEKMLSVRVTSPNVTGSLSSRVFFAKNDPKVSGQLRLEIKRLLPGRQTIRITSFLQQSVQLRADLQMIPSKIEADSYEENDTPSTKKPLLEHVSPYLVNWSSGLTIHEKGDVDFLTLSLPPDGLSSYCDASKEITGPHGKKVIPGRLEVWIEREDAGRRMRLAVYRSGQQYGSASFSNTGVTEIVCPHSVFASQKGVVTLRLEDVNQLRGLYSIAFRFRETSENIPPLFFPPPDYVPDPLLEDEEDLIRSLVNPDGITDPVPDQFEGPGVVRPRAGVDLAQVVGAEQRIPGGARVLPELPAVLQHQGVHHRDRDRLLQPLQRSEHQRSVRPPAGERHVEVIAIQRRREARRAVGGDAVPEGALVAHEAAAGRRGVVPDVLPLPVDEHPH